jgi:hypothetical protein
MEALQSEAQLGLSENTIDQGCVVGPYPSAVSNEAAASPNASPSSGEAPSDLTLQNGESAVPAGDSWGARSAYYGGLSEWRASYHRARVSGDAAATQRLTSLLVHRRKLVERLSSPSATRRARTMDGRDPVKVRLVLRSVRFIKIYISYIVSLNTKLI